MTIDQDRTQITIRVNRDEALLLASELIALAQSKGSNGRGTQTTVFMPGYAYGRFMLAEKEVRLAFHQAEYFDEETE